MSLKVQHILKEWFYNNFGEKKQVFDIYLSEDLFFYKTY